MKLTFILFLFSVMVESFLLQKLHFWGRINLGDKLRSFLQSYIPKVARDVKNLEVKSPPKLLSKPRRLSNGVEVDDIKRNYVNAVLGYCDRERIFTTDCICRETFHDVSISKQFGVESVVVIAANVKLRKLVVSYRPTMTITNWIYNLNYPSIRLPGAPNNITVHRGFFNYYNSTIKQSHDAMDKLLKNPKYKDYPIQLTGYSLGGGIATLSAPGWVDYLKNRNEKRKLEVFSYAGPRVGNKAYADYVSCLNITVVRYTNRNDVVNHLPPRSFGFAHVGTEFYDRKVDRKNAKLEKCSEDYEEDPNCSLGVKQVYSGKRHAYPFSALFLLPPVCET